MNTNPSTKAVPIDEARAFELDELFFSITDPEGRIEAGNDVFVRISGYSRDELIGRPHNIIRHPDMPRIVFKVLWDYLEAGRMIAAYVKNMAKDGRFYWVMALVSPIPGGYLSVRFKPISPLLATVGKLYERLTSVERKIESEPEGTKQKAMAASYPLLVNALKSLGFADYDAFMRTAMLGEIRERNKALKALGPLESDHTTARLADNSASPLLQACSSAGAAVDELFDHVDDVTAVENVVGSIGHFIADSANSMKLLSLNAKIEAIKLGDTARPISVVANWLDFSLATALSETNNLSGIFSKVVDDVRISLFELACAKLQIEVMQSFLQSSRRVEQNALSVSRDETMRLVRVLCESMSKQMKHAFKMLEILPHSSKALVKGLELINKQQRTLRVLHVAGNVEIARLPNQTTLTGVFDEVAHLIERTDDKVTALQEAVGTIQCFVECAPVSKALVARTVEQMGHFTLSLA